jgi:hypothetical protein
MDTINRPNHCRRKSIDQTRYPIGATMKRLLVVSLCAAAITLTAGAGYTLLERWSPAQRPTEAATTNEVRRSSGESKSEPGADEPQARINRYADALATSNNYLDFANATIRDAESGNRDAQYFLGKALAFCDGTYSMYFERKGQVLTLDEALMWAARLGRSGAYVQRVYDRCHELKDHAKGFADSSEWIDAAATAGQPAALAATALKRLSDAAIPNSTVAANRSPATEDDPIAKSRANLRVAVESKDPEVLWQIGLAQGFLGANFQEKVKDEMAWWLVSCQRGYDCSAHADWITLDCPDESFCTPGISGIDYIRNGAGADWPEVQLRAQQINAKLDAGKWGELGLDM